MKLFVIALVLTLVSCRPDCSSTDSTCSSSTDTETTTGSSSTDTETTTGSSGTSATPVLCPGKDESDYCDCEGDCGSDMCSCPKAKECCGLEVAKCYCEHQDGAMPDNGILCSKGGNVERIAYCSTDEKCTGTTDPEATDAANETNYGVLCTKETA